MQIKRVYEITAEYGAEGKIVYGYWERLSETEETNKRSVSGDDFKSFSKVDLAKYQRTLKNQLEKGVEKASLTFTITTDTNKKPVLCGR